MANYSLSKKVKYQSWKYFLRNVFYSDLLVGYGAVILQLIDNEIVNELLTQGRRSKTGKTKMLSTWATKEMRKLKNQTSAAASW